jgi:YVTN family beta-propeller protein
MVSGRIAMKARQISFLLAASIAAILLAPVTPRAQTASPSLLVLEKGDNMLAIVDPGSLKIIARVPAGTDPHEVVASPDGKVAYISNYGGSDSDLHTISVVNLPGHAALPPIDLGALRSAHGLFFAGGKLYFTAETNKVIGQYDPAIQQINWVMGTGQDRTHMVWVAPSLDRIVTSNVNSGTISIIQKITVPPPQGAPPPSRAPKVFQSGPRKTWEVTNVKSGAGSEGFDVSPDEKEVWAANAEDNTVTIIDFAAKKAIKTVPIPVRGANRLKFTLDGKYVLVSGLGGPSLGGQSSPPPNLVVLDAATRKEIKKISLGGGSGGILMEPGGARAYIAVSAANKVAVIDLHTWEVTGEIATGKNPDGLAWATSQ